MRHFTNGIQTFRIVGMKTEFAFDRHRNVDLGLALSFAFKTARFIAGCYVHINFSIKDTRMEHTKGIIFSAPSISSLVPPLACNSRRD